MFWAHPSLDCGTGKQRNKVPLMPVFAHYLPADVLKPMKCSWQARKSSTCSVGWTVESYQESDSEDGHGQQPR